ncbi:MAG: sigma-70 family RNA polymerase sigma factor [Oscillospiraceae bacterium]
MNLDFSECVKKAQGGDADAFAKLYSLVYKDLYHIALCNLRNQHDASDVVSDAVLDAFTSIKKLRDEKAFKAWIVRILTAKIKNKQREYIENNGTQDIEDVEQELTKEENFGGIEIMEEIANLDQNERLVLSLNVVAGYTSDEIAKMTKANPSTVRSKLSRAKIKLKQRLITE